MKKFLILFFLFFSKFSNIQAEENIKQELYIIGNFYDKDDRYIKLSDNTYWKLNKDYNLNVINKIFGIEKESIWKNYEKIEITTSYDTTYPYILTNLDRNVKVEARQIDPLLEHVYRQLMRYHYCAGNKQQALKVYRNCEKLFNELLGEGLAPQTRRLFEAISNDAELDQEF